MIERYSDHAANERTFLAWIRTAIAVMAFGFLVERFDLFLQIAGQTLARRALSPGGQLAGNVAGLILIALGAAIIVIALLRFRKNGARDRQSGAAARFGRAARRGAGRAPCHSGNCALCLPVLYGDQPPLAI